MSKTAGLLILSTTLAFASFACYDHSPAPPRVAVASNDYREPRPVAPSEPPPKPLPGDTYGSPPPGYGDEPLLVQRPPEQRAFLDAYARVGRPRLTVFVNRSLEGDIVDAKGNVEHNATYLRPGEYDEVSARSLDYNAIENILSDWLAANGQTTLISPGMARQRMTEDQLKDIQSGRPRALSEIAQQLGVDVLVQVQAHPTKQTAQGLEVRLVAEALNIKGGQSIGRAVVDVPPPLVKTTINTYTRYLARKLMDDMTTSWTAMAQNAPPPPPPPPHTEVAPPPPSAPPAPTPAPAQTAPKSTE